MGFAFYGLPFFYDFFVQELGWTRAQVTSGNAFAKLVIGPLFGFFAGVVRGPLRAPAADARRHPPRRARPVGLGGTTTLVAFYTFYLMNALGYVTGGPLPNQVMLSRWFDAGRGKAMGIAYLGIGVGGALVPLLAHALTEALGWRTALEGPRRPDDRDRLPAGLLRARAGGGRREAAGRRAPPARPGRRVEDSILDVLRQPAFYLLALGSMASIGAVGGTTQNLKLFFAMDRGMAQGRVARAHLARPRREHRGAPADGLARRPLAPEEGDAPHLPDRGGHHPAPVGRALAGHAPGRRRRRSASASAATT